MRLEQNETHGCGTRTGVNSKNSLTPREKPDDAKGSRRKREGKRKADKERRTRPREDVRTGFVKWGIRIKIVPSIGTRAGRSFLFFLISCRGPLAGPIRAPMLQSASEHGGNQISGTAMRIVSRPPNIKRRSRSRERGAPSLGRRSRVAFDRIRDRLIWR